jgi:predicted AlkP superfamily pyrophosphatase or phosphodiesterase
LPEGGAYDRVVFFLIDAFGWRFFERYADTPFLRGALEGGVVSQLTSMFPSTTVVHLTSSHTGLDAAATGIPEWFYYEPKVDAIIAPLLFSYAGDMDRETLAKAGVVPESIFPRHNLYQDLARVGVKSTVSGHRDYARSSYNNVVINGADSLPYRTWPEALTNLTLRFEQEQAGRAAANYYYMYFGEIDGHGHTYGPGSRQLAAEAECLLMLMARFLDDCRRRWPRTLILLTADHGVSETDPATTIYLNLRFPGFERYLKTDRQGRPLLFGGSPRDLFLYVRDECLDEVHDLLTRELAGKAEVMRTAELIQVGLFGAPASPDELLIRTGNLMILSHRYESVAWYEKGRFEQKHYGHHGGLTREEMLIPFVAVAT